MTEDNSDHKIVPIIFGITGAIITFSIIYMTGIINLIVYITLAENFDETTANNYLIIFDFLISIVIGYLVYSFVKGISSK